MPEVNETMTEKLRQFPAPIGDLCEKIVIFAQTMPEQAVKEHLDDLVRRAVKKENLRP